MKVYVVLEDIILLVIGAFQGLVLFALLWVALVVFGAWLYDRSVTQGIRRNNEKCSKEIV